MIPILGTTDTGELEPIEEIHDLVVASNAEHGTDIPIHVDAASGGFVAPFLVVQLLDDVHVDIARPSPVPMLSCSVRHSAASSSHS